MSITVPEEGYISEITVDKTYIKKAPNDPIALRISLGGSTESNYLVYRGDEEEIHKLLKTAIRSFEKMLKEQNPELLVPNTK